MTPLNGHTNQENAYLVESYPYGGMRCRIKFWIESNKRGFRFVSQTENPKTLRWNNPKQSTYCAYGMEMYLDEKNHVHYRALTPGSSVDDVLSFLKDFPTYVPTIELKAMALVGHRIADKTSKGEATMTINGVPQLPGAGEIERAGQELLKWREVLNLIRR